MSTRLRDRNTLYTLLDTLRARAGGYRYLKHTSGRSGWPERGVYFFFAQGEGRDDGHGLQQVRAAEYPLERDVSAYIGELPFLWVGVPDAAGSGSHRRTIEANAIALLSNHGRTPIDAASPAWLGRHADHPAIRASGLWNVNHVEAPYDRAFLDLLASYVDRPCENP